MIQKWGLGPSGPIGVYAYDIDIDKARLRFMLCANSIFVTSVKTAKSYEWDDANERYYVASLFSGCESVSKISICFTYATVKVL